MAGGAGTVSTDWRPRDGPAPHWLFPAPNGWIRNGQLRDLSRARTPAGDEDKPDRKAEEDGFGVPDATVSAFWDGTPFAKRPVLGPRHSPTPTPTTAKAVCKARTAASQDVDWIPTTILMPGNAAEQCGNFTAGYFDLREDVHAYSILWM
ncbi:hypothetical protein VTJ04DRAFT_4119 [Mycothermus thermophilus]|uniref:uncharacterized protein n=1 Tax=Humicola insolens TaxID=85995 RepID=UPI0037422805